MATKDIVTGRIAQLKTTCVAVESRANSENITTQMARKETNRVGVERRPPRTTRQTPSLQAEVKTNRGPGLSTDPLKSPPTMPIIVQPKEVVLASLKNSEGNDRWVNRAKDES